MIYACFSGTGKTRLADHTDNFKDMESSDYQWVNYPPLNI